jgi:penicillin-binding protein 1C
VRSARHITALAIALTLAAAARDSFDAWIDDTNLPILVSEVTTEVIDRNGELLRAFQVSDGRWRMAVTASQVDPRYIDMLVRFEDKRFWSHNGVDPIAMLRALGQAVWNGRIVSGASTLTMQTARLLEESGTGSWRGKLRQIRLAYALERKLGKQAILSLYLQHAPFGGNLEGVRSASFAYFGKEPKRLTPAEAALLIALPQSPEARRPDRNPELAENARNRVLMRLSATGILESETVQAAQFEPVPTQRREFPASAPHVAQRAKSDSSAQRIPVSLDATAQSALQKLARQSVARQGDKLSIAILAADHRTGEIIASVGSASFGNTRSLGFIDMTRAQRSPGSTLKPLIYAMSFDAGLAHPETLIDDKPTRFGSYAPKNFDGEFRGELRIREALQASLNLPVVSLLDRLGPSNLTAKLSEVGVQYDIPGGKPGLAVALGGVGISLHDMVQLYAMLARQGSAIDLTTEIDPIQAQNRILSRRAAWYVTDILKGIPAPPNARSNQIAYKTGTSYGHRDAWAIGYDGAHVIGVWMGRPDGTPVPGAFGGELAAPVLFQAFEKLKAQITTLPPPPADALTLANADLPRALQRFRPRGAAQADLNAPRVAFPPNGAQIESGGASVFVKIEDGTAPFTWLANGTPLQTGKWDRQVEILPDGRGYLSVTIIDANGLSDRTEVFVQ